MKEILLWGLLVCILGGALVQALLRLEERGWINYRRHGLSRGAMAYHAIELDSIFNPGAQQVAEVRFEERKRQDQGGDPPGKAHDDSPPEEPRSPGSCDRGGA